ncbi:hypothetical protein BN938_1250 [Mucinivorans hirudinis]|uniref:Uncharacterized protein n=1 Tax=Mucinivorans hirudinis TaxID=1433126 RepID=A0A060RC61_9BACT|nr:hypothetical protein BN938_1250 [Mucinivorans hirudinis]
MNDDVINKNDDGFKLFMGTVERLIKSVDALRKRNRPLLGGHRYLVVFQIS